MEHENESHETVQIDKNSSRQDWNKLTVYSYFQGSTLGSLCYKRKLTFQLIKETGKHLYYGLFCLNENRVFFFLLFLTEVAR